MAIASVLLLLGSNLHVCVLCRPPSRILRCVLACSGLMLGRFPNEGRSLGAPYLPGLTGVSHQPQEWLLMSSGSGGNKQSHQRNSSARLMVLVALDLWMVGHG